MKTVFADTGYWITLMNNNRDAIAIFKHKKAV
jgi:hypothetical protein